MGRRLTGDELSDPIQFSIPIINHVAAIFAEWCVKSGLESGIAADGVTPADGCDNVRAGGVAMFKWIAGLWNKMMRWMRGPARPNRSARPIPPAYLRSNLHGRHR